MHADLSDYTIFRVIQASGACVVNCPQLIDSLFAGKAEPNKEQTEESEVLLDEASAGSGEIGIASLQVDSARYLNKNAGLAGQVKELRDAFSSESPKRDEAEEGYAKVEEELGGRAGIDKFAEKSQKLEKEVTRRIKGEPWRQDVIFHHEGLQALSPLS